MQMLLIVAMLAQCPSGQCRVAVLHHPVYVAQGPARPAVAVPVRRTRPAPTPAPPADAAAFLAWLNEYRAAYNLSAVAWDARLAADAALNNALCRRFGLGHWTYGPWRWTDAARCPSLNSAASLWVGSPPHRANLLAPGARLAGVAFDGMYATLDLR